MRKLKIYLSPLYIIFAFVVVYFGGFSIFCYYFVSLIIHEYSHYFLSKRLGYMLNSLNFMPYGAKLDGETIYKKRSHEIAISLAGPMSNIIIALLFMAVWWLNPIIYGYTKEFVEANIYLGVFNLLPIFPLDGGHVLINLFNNDKKKKKAYIFMQVIGIIICVVLMILFILSAFKKLNFSLFFISLFLMVVFIAPYRGSYYKSIRKINNNKKFIRELKQYIVYEDINLLQLVKYFDENYYVCFSFYKDKNNIKNLTQQEVLKLLENGIYIVP